MGHIKRKEDGKVSFENIDMGKNVSLVCQEEGRAVFKMMDDTGDGRMTMYNVFPGVVVLYNDFHMERCASGFRSNRNMLCIDHCREGRIEWEMPHNSYVYVEEGDLQVDTRKCHFRDFNFPLSHYHGITVGFLLEEAAEPLANVLEGITIDLHFLKKKYCPEDRAFFMRAGRNIEHIFSELYDLPEQVRIPYLKIKVLELLLFLRIQEIPASGGERPYFYKTQVDKVKAMKEFLTEDITRHYTLEELSERFDFPLTSMKLCFKGVYGTSVYAYMKDYRMNAAAQMLRRSDVSIVNIANRVGYENASKFSAAFKSVMGMTPTIYRKSGV